MKKVLVLLMVLLSVCSTAFAEGLEDVLKDCKLDRSRWKVVEWFKAEKFVRLYDSQAVAVISPGQFDVVIYDYYYGNVCEKSNCQQQGKRHYHSAKWGFNTSSSTGTLRSFETRDIDGNVVDSYNYPAKMQIASPLKRNSTEAKTMQKIKEPLKNNKDFAAPPKPDPTPVTSNPIPAPTRTGLAPLPMAIGAVDGEWTYMGRFIQQNSYPTIFEWETRMRPYTGTTESSGLFDVYYNHRHGASSEGQGCGDEGYGFFYGCVIKIVPLNSNGLPYNQSGVQYGTHLLSINGGCKGTFGAGLQRLRTFDSVTHQQLINVTSRENPSLMGRFSDSAYEMWKVREKSPFYLAMKMSNCPNYY